MRFFIFPPLQIADEFRCCRFGTWSRSRQTGQTRLLLTSLQNDSSVVPSYLRLVLLKWPLRNTRLHSTAFKNSSSLMPLRSIRGRAVNQQQQTASREVHLRKKTANSYSGGFTSNWQQRSRLLMMRKGSSQHLECFFLTAPPTFRAKYFNLIFLDSGPEFEGINRVTKSSVSACLLFFLVFFFCLSF